MRQTKITLSYFSNNAFKNQGKKISSETLKNLLNYESNNANAKILMLLELCKI